MSQPSRCGGIVTGTFDYPHRAAGQLLRYARVSARSGYLTQRQLATLADIDFVTYTKYEAGRLPVPPDALARIAQALGVDTPAITAPPIQVDPA